MEIDQYDVVVIGSGFGGAVTACRLAEAGNSVCILERGRQWDRKSKFPRSLDQLADSLWQDGKSFGFIEYLTFENMDVIQGSGVGGGSLHYYNVHIRTPAKIFEKKEWPKNITLKGTGTIKGLDVFYDMVREMLDAKPLKAPTDDLPESYQYDVPTRTQAFYAAVQNSKDAKENPEPSVDFKRAVTNFNYMDDSDQPPWTAKNVDLAVYTGAQRQPAIIDHDEHPQSPCDHTGFCLMGCRINAKNTLDLNYIATAVRNGACVRPLHKVVDIRPDPDGGGYWVDFHKYTWDEKGGDVVRNDDGTGKWERGTVHGDKVIVAAGALGSTELLLRCKNAKLPELRPQLGKRFSGNGDLLLAATVDAQRDVDPSQGPTITAGVDVTRSDGPEIYIEDLGYPNAFMWLLNAVASGKERSLDALTLAMRYLAVDRGQSTGHASLGAHAALVLKGGETSRCLPYLGMGEDAADGELSLSHVTHIFKGEVTNRYNFPLPEGVSKGDPFRAVLAYDPSQLPVAGPPSQKASEAYYANFSFALSVGALTWSADPSSTILVRHGGPSYDEIEILATKPGSAGFTLMGKTKRVFSSRDLPTSLDFPKFMSKSDSSYVQVMWAEGKYVSCKITSIESTQGSGSLEVTWNHEASREMFEEMEQAMKDLSEGLGGKYLPSVYWAADRLLTAHPLGGCTMGDDSKFDVVNEYGEVNGYPGLYVADGAIIPTALARNPSATIAALAERIAYYINHPNERS